MSESTKSYTFNLLMGIEDGEQQYSAPQGYKYLSITNGTKNKLTIYQSSTLRSLASPSQILAQVPMFTMMTVPLLETGVDFTFVWDFGGDLGVNMAQLIFSNTNLNINGLIGSPGSTGTVSLTSDAVGLARKNQLPSALQNDALKVAVMSGLDTSGITQKAQLPATLGSKGGLKVEMLNDLNVAVNVPVDSSQTWGTGSITPGAVSALSNQACREVTLIADAANAAAIKFGDKASTCVVPLPPGGSVTLPVANMSMIYTQSDQAATLYYVWRS